MPRAVVAVLAALLAGACGMQSPPAAPVPYRAAPSFSPSPSPSPSLSPSPSPSSPGSRAASALLPPAVGVILIHGYGGDPSDMKVLAAHLRSRGLHPVVVEVPDHARGDIDDASAVVDAVVRSLPAGPVDLVGFSLGGVIARAWVRNHDDGRARVVVTLGTPHYGVRLAASARDSGSDCPTACQQLAPDSEFMSRLNEGDPTPGAARWISVRSDDDQVVEAVSTQLPEALWLRLQVVCPGRHIGHGALARDALSVGLAVRALQGRLPGVPATAECAALVREGS